ncbi:hypothetical protein GE061_013266 [Apolygus lucorum]|uniref:Uncharacterized protein n=1 Tax=Apolygus lucorum TaxID=248454 RepID=A0A8S9XNI2_APOLU|nr:hypothetical protein GE061_013266 [Apolygus lucorum]
MLFESRKKPGGPAGIQLGSTSLPYSEKTKFLGVVIDRTLSCRYHAQELAGKLASVCFALRKLKAITSKEALMSAYHGLFVSRATYGILFCATDANLLSVFVAQKRALRIIQRRPALSSCRFHFTRERLLTIYSLYIVDALTFVRRHSHYFAGLLFNHDHDTRFGGVILRVPQHRLHFFERSPMSRVLACSWSGKAFMLKAPQTDRCQMPKTGVTTFTMYRGKAAPGVRPASLFPF